MWCQVRRAVAAAVGAVLLLVWESLGVAGEEWPDGGCKWTISEAGAAAGRSKSHHALSARALPRQSLNSVAAIHI